MEMKYLSELKHKKALTNSGIRKMDKNEKQKHLTKWGKRKHELVNNFGKMKINLVMTH